MSMRGVKQDRDWLGGRIRIWFVIMLFVGGVERVLHMRVRRGGEELGWESKEKKNEEREQRIEGG